MIDQETQLRLQAYLDGELPAGDRRAVAEWLDRDPEARIRLAELQHLKSLLVGNELDRPLPETREFFWARVELGIRTPEPPAPVAPLTPWAAGWLKWLVPAAAVALFVCLMLPMLREGPDTQTPVLSQAQEIETPLSQASFISFRSEADGMSVVWVDTHANY